MDYGIFFEALKGLEYYVLAGAFALARMAGLMAIMPLFSRIRLTGVLRNGAALALTVPVIPMIASVLPGIEVTTLFILLLMFKEVLIGLMLGFVLGIPFWAAEAAGDIVDLQRGSTMGALLDPMMTHQTSPTGTFLAIVMLVVFLAAGGLELVLTIHYRSYELWPIDQIMPTISQEAAELFLELLDRLLAMALILVFPLVVGLLLSDLVLGFLARASPHLNIFALSLIVKTLIFSLILVLYASFLVHFMGTNLEFLNDIEKYIEIIA
ncbi:type III secretion protein T [Mesorhizobium sp. J18]|uniref:type III secretion system export apparatus subunit SctT n=1 Tax=Mesorhizobium sp. J18 TaxID=935263 RepID=UPI00119BD3C2|nr:type III secretion system export apparatus subunit SctT [Mesorhizobium sp. J18]TWG99539.1 type III secretion protein T [Mesorhizobium sp. J18]